ncbi:MAG: DUF2828 family protein [Lachnospiraceae bacterium]|nr:DUF2828 family protein [Lachnospiraceae bacterium]
MERAFRYDGKDMDKQIPDYINMGNAANYMKRYQNRSVTENGAVGYRTTLHSLVDLNFMVSSLRNREEEFITRAFIKAYYDSPKYAVKWLFFLRDIREGMGERRTFRVCMKYLAESHLEIAKAVMELIPEYGRFDDLLVFLNTGLEDEVCQLMKAQLDMDLLAMREQKPISLLAKWLPSINTSSKETRKCAQRLAEKFGMNACQYRKMVSALRAYGDVVEVKMSASRWGEIAYETVPAKANLKYDRAFAKHDEERRSEYLWKVFEGDEQLNTKGIMPYEVVRRFTKNAGYRCALKDDLLAELMWQHIVEQGFQNEWGFDDCIVVADGSGSMYDNASGSTSVTAIEICNSLAIYFAGQLKGVFHNKAITFSSRPQFIDLEKGNSLKEKLEIMLAHNEIANTNIEAVFDMLLDMAVSNAVPAEELPKQVLIISDMEFDAASAPDRWLSRDEAWNEFTPALFESIEKRYEQTGYKLPRLIFWNVCGRTDTIPKVDNEQGICLLSGFSQNAMKIAADREKKDPYDSLIRVLDGPRYEAVEKAMMGWRRREEGEEAVKNGIDLNM